MFSNQQAAATVGQVGVSGTAIDNNTRTHTNTHTHKTRPSLNNVELEGFISYQE